MGVRLVFLILYDTFHQRTQAIARLFKWFDDDSKSGVRQRTKGSNPFRSAIEIPEFIGLRDLSCLPENYDLVGSRLGVDITQCYP